MSERVKRILEILETSQIEIVSFGLAPNPDGFCFEADDPCSPEAEELSQLLDELVGHEILQLKGMTLGF